MNTHSQSAHPPSQLSLSTDNFEEVVVISQIPKEKEYLHSRVLLLETQLSWLLNDHLALQVQCDALTASVKFLEDAVANSAELSIPKTASSSSK